MTDFDAEIAKHERAIAEAKEAKARFLAESPAAQLALTMHEAQCHSDHTEMCGWYYEIDKGVHNWQGGYSHKRWLEKAEAALRLLPGFTIDEIVRVAKALA